MTENRPVKWGRLFKMICLKINIIILHLPYLENIHNYDCFLDGFIMTQEAQMHNLDHYRAPVSTITISTTTIAATTH